jgi:hypothetical protein
MDVVVALLLAEKVEMREESEEGGWTVVVFWK